MLQTGAHSGQSLEKEQKKTEMRENEREISGAEQLDKKYK